MGNLPMSAIANPHLLVVEALATLAEGPGGASKKYCAKTQKSYLIRPRQVPMNSVSESKLPGVGRTVFSGGRFENLDYGEKGA
jgi:hypothetical protein